MESLATLDQSLRLLERLEATKDQGAFRKSLRDAVRGLWGGYFDLADFVDAVGATVERRLPEAWYEGAAQCGIKPEDLTEDEQRQLQRMIEDEAAYVVAFGQDILVGRESGGKVQTYLARAELWANRYNAVRAQAQVMGCRDQKLEWAWNPIKEHCEDCAMLNGRVYRASTWEAYDIRPQSRDLQCQGFRCGCSFRVTDQRVTPGRPPALVGP